MVRITTIMDNNASEHKALISKHGLSLYVETEKDSLIFDCGSDNDTLYNAMLLGIDISSVKHVVCSHSHYDHAGGLLGMLSEGFHGKFYSGKGFFDKKYAYNGGKYTFLGIPFNYNTLVQNGITHVVCEDVLNIFDNCYLVANFSRIYPFEEIPSRFVKEVNGNIQRDLFDDEICLVIRTEQGLILIVGCSHPGILNMLSYVGKLFNEPIYAVIGGTHLVEADDERIKTTLKVLQDMGVQYIGLSHCSGDRVQDYMQQKGMQNFLMSVGSVAMF